MVLRLHMNKILIKIITLYQLYLVAIIKQLLGVTCLCRNTPSCSEFTKQAIQKYGILKGLRLGIIRILHCSPFNKEYGATI